MAFKNRFLVGTVLLAGTISLSACQTTSMQRTGIANNPDDVCNAERVALDATGQAFLGDIVANTVVGAGLGAGIGAAIAAVTGGDVVTGAVSGAALGGATGYWASISQGAEGQGRVLGIRIRDDLQAENQRIREFDRQLQALIDCRTEEADAIRAQMAAGSLDRSVAESQMAEVRSRFQDDLRLARDVNERIQGRSEQLLEASSRVSTEAIDFSDPAVRVARTGMNVRQGPSQSSAILRSLRPGQEVVTGMTDGGWTAVTIAGGQTGWASSNLLIFPHEYQAALRSAAQSDQVEVELDPELSSAVRDQTLSNQLARAGVASTLAEGEALAEGETGEPTFELM